MACRPVEGYAVPLFRATKWARDRFGSGGPSKKVVVGSAPVHKNLRAARKSRKLMKHTYDARWLAPVILNKLFV